MSYVLQVELEDVEPIHYYRGNDGRWIRECCAIVGHKPVRLEAGIVWRECDRCGTHLSGPKPTSTQSMDARLKRTFSPAYFEKILNAPSAFYAMVTE